MGSSTLQCALSRETIKEDDEVVTFLLEPNNPDGNISHINQLITHQSQHFKMGSLPVFGCYADYGKVDALYPDSLAVRMAKELYQYDFSRDTNESVGSSGDNIMLGGFTSEYDKSHTLQWTISKAAYDALMANADLNGIKQSLSLGGQDKRLNELLHEDLLNKLSEIESTDKTDVLANTLAFTKALNDLCVPFHIQSTRTCQTAAWDDKGRIRLHASLKDKCSQDNGSNNSMKALWTCAITGNALAPNDKAFILPIDDKLSLDENSNAIYFDNHKVTGMYALAAPEIAVTMTNNLQFSLAKPLSEVQRRFVRGQVVASNTIIEDQELINMLTSGELNYKDRFNHYHRNAMVFSEQAYLALVKDNQPTLIDSFNRWRETVEMLKQMHEASPDNIDQVKHLIPDEYPHIKWLEDMFYNPEAEHLQRENIQKTALAHLVDDKKERTVDVVDYFKFNAESEIFTMPGTGDEWSKNAFSEIFNNHGDLSHLLRSVFKGNLVTNFRRNNLDSVKSALNFMEIIAKEFNSTYNLVNGLHNYNLSVIPSHQVQSELSVDEQRDLNQSMRAITTLAIIKRCQEWNDECSL